MLDQYQSKTEVIGIQVDIEDFLERVNKEPSYYDQFNYRVEAEKALKRFFAELPNQIRLISDLVANKSLAKMPFKIGIPLAWIRYMNHIALPCLFYFDYALSGYEFAELKDAFGNCDDWPAKGLSSISKDSKVVTVFNHNPYK